MFESRLEAILNETETREITIGAEMEVYVIDHAEEPPVLLQSSSVIEDIYNNFDERVYRDYYTYQLEIRTNPSDDPHEVYKQMYQLIRKASKVAREYQCYIAPVSYVEDRQEDPVFCGFHIHIAPRNSSTQELIRMLLSMYPVIYDIARISLSSPAIDENLGEILSKRIAYSRHIGLLEPPLYMPFLESLFINERDRYFDIALNLNTRKDGYSDRHRIKDVTTIEIRVFDSIGSKEALKTVIEATYAIGRRVKTEYIQEALKDPKKSIKFIDTLATIRRMLILNRKYFNPFLLTYVHETLEFLDIDTSITETWIKHEFLDWLAVSDVSFHKDIQYPI